MNVGSSTTYQRDPGETTEWEDILRSKGIIPESKENIARREREAAEAAIEAAVAPVDVLANASLDQLKEIDESGAYDDTRELEEYRRRRIEQLKQKAARNRFGEIIPLSRADWDMDVVEASKHAWVVVLLYKDAVSESRLLQQVLSRVAAKFMDVKFMQIVSDQCIEHYPDHFVPTLLFYHNGEKKSELVGVSVFGGAKLNAQTIEWVLAQQDVVETELIEDPRKNLLSTFRHTAGGRRHDVDPGSDHDDDND